jgi:glycosyltransferase involved in cell wall biosynthesis
VILPTFNRAACLRLAVESVVRQTLVDWELIIADDGSGEETRSYLAGLRDRRVRIVWLAHSGNPSSVRNAAIASARGTYLAFLDSDDVWLRHKLEAQTAAMRLNPRRRWSYTFNSRIDELGNLLSDEGVSPFRLLDGDVTEALLTLDAALATPTIMAERSLVLEVGGFDADQLFAEDYDLWLRLSLRSHVTVLPEPLASVRVHTDNYSQDRLGAYRGWVRLYDKMANLVGDPRLEGICRRLQSENALTLAGLYVDRRAPVALAWKALAASSRNGWTSRGWWARAAKIAVRSVLPDGIVTALRR